MKAAGYANAEPGEDEDHVAGVAHRRAESHDGERADEAQGEREGGLDDGDDEHRRHRDRENVPQCQP